MKNLNEDINRLRQIMSYNRSKGLLISESQYSIEDSTDIDEQEMKHLNTKGDMGFELTKDEIMKDKKLAKSIANQIYNASKGMGTDEDMFLDAIKDIDSLVTLKFTNGYLKRTNYGDDTQGFEFFVNDEFGYEDADVVGSAVRHLNSIGAKAEHKTEGRNFVSGSFKLGVSLEDIEIRQIPEREDKKPVDSEKPSNPVNDKEEDKGCPTEEDVLTGKFAISIKSMGDKRCNVVHTIQKALLDVLGEQKGGMSLGANDFGYYGPKTVALVVAFQSLDGLKVDGIVGKNTMKALLSKGGAKDTPQGGYTTDV